MRWRLILAVSVVLNVALGIVLLGGKRHPAALPETGLLQAAGTNRTKTEVVVRKQFFSWRQVESADYPAYILNLRDIGCPEQTVRDIIVADVNQLYAKKRMEAVDTPEEQWWHAQPDTNFIAAAKAKLDALDAERRSLLTTLLGTNWDMTIPVTTKQVVALNGPVLGDLSPETKDSVQKIIASSQDRVKAYLDAQQKAGKKPDPAEIARMEKQVRSELAQVLNAAQMEEFLLRYSQTATNLRNQLRGFEATPDEFRTMFRSRDQVEQQLPFIAGDTATVAAEQAAYQKQEDDAIKSALGADRYQQYLLTQDPAYRAAVDLAQQAGGTPEMAQRLYALNKAVVQERDRIQNDPTLSDDEKQARLATLDQQQQAVGDQILGIAPPPPAPLPTPTGPPIAAVHSYAPGETIDMIAARYGVSSGAILSANPGLDPNVLARGTQIRIPKLQ